MSFSTLKSPSVPLAPLRQVGRWLPETLAWCRAQPAFARFSAGVWIICLVMIGLTLLGSDIAPSVRHSLQFVPVVLAAFFFGMAGGAATALFGLLFCYLIDTEAPTADTLVWAAFFAPASAALVFGTDALYTARGMAKRAKRIWRSERRLRLFVEQAPAAMAVFDRDLRYLVASRRWLQDYGLSTKQILGQSHYDIFPQIPHRWRDVHSSALSGQIVRAEEDAFIDLDGRPRWLTWEVRPWYFDDHAIGGIIIYTEDVTERCLAHQELSATQRLNAQILQAIPGQMAVIDGEGTIVAVNEAWSRFARENGIMSDTALGVGTNYLAVCERAAQTEPMARNAHAGIRDVLTGKVASFNLEYPCRVGATVAWYDMSVVPLDSRGAAGAVITHLDISDRKKVEEDMIRAEGLRAVGELAGGIAHDFGNLLTVITGNLQLAEMDIETNPMKALTYIRAALDAAERGAGANRRLLAMSEKRPIRRRPVVVAEVVEQTTRILKRTLGETITIVSSIAPDLWATAIDPGELEGAVLNLALNARDAMPTGGILNITLENVVVAEGEAGGERPLPPGQYVRLGVSDTGQGMSPEVLRRAAEPFFTTKGPGKGVGLGLASVARVADSTGGHLTIQSNVGGGTQVFLYLPRCDSDPALAAVAAGLPLKRGNGELVLVVEDDAEVRDVVVKRVEALGYRVVSAACAVQAIPILKSTPDIRLVFSDVVMPGNMSGYDLVRWVSTHAPHISTLLTSGYNLGDPDAAAGGEDTLILAKPYTVTQLATAIAAALQARPLH